MRPEVQICQYRYLGLGIPAGSRFLRRPDQPPRRASSTKRWSPNAGVPQPPESIVGLAGYFATKIARDFRLHEHDREDIRGELIVAIVRATHRFDPAKGSLVGFCRGALELQRRHIIRRLIVEQRRQRVVREWPCTDDGPVDFPDRCRDHIAAADVTADLAEAIALLNHHERWLVEDLKTLRASEIAERRGVHRGTIYRQLESIRTKLRPFLEG